VSCSGAGNHCASTPATTGPIAKPAVSATVDRRAPVPSGSPAESSFTQAVPGAMTNPTPIPWAMRPENSSAGESGPTSSRTLPTSIRTIEIRTIGRLPWCCDTHAATSSAGTSPPTYAANMPVTSCSDRPRSARYTSSIGANWLAPHPAVSMASATRRHVRGVAAACRGSMPPILPRPTSRAVTFRPGGPDRCRVPRGPAWPQGATSDLDPA